MSEPPKHMEAALSGRFDPCLLKDLVSRRTRKEATALQVLDERASSVRYHIVVDSQGFQPGHCLREGS